MIIAQLSDLHICPRGVPYNRAGESNMMAERALRAVARMEPRPDVIIITGDIAEKGLPEEYAEFLEIMKRRLPGGAHLIPGNHDNREAFVAALKPPVATTGFVDYVIEAEPVRIVMLDTLMAGSHAGMLRRSQLEWLQATLAEKPDAPTLIAMHHAPFRIGIGHLDMIGLMSPEKFAAVLARHPQVERILCGHCHRQIVGSIGKTIAIVAPSTAAQVVLDLAPSAPSAFVKEPAQFNVHIWSEADGFVTHTAFVEEFEGPYPYLD